MPPAAAPPPAAPASPPPAAAPSAAPPAGAPPAAEAPPDHWLNDVDNELADLDAGREPTPPPAKPAGKAPVKPVEKPAGEIPPPKPGEKPPETPPAAPKAPVKVADLRAAYEAVTKKVKDEYEPAIARVAELQAKVAEFEKNGTGDTKALTERATKAEARAAELEAAVQFADYKKSAEFRDKYHQPYVEAWNRAISDFSQLTVRVPTGEVDQGTGQQTFVTRKATDQDLLSLANMPLSEMDSAAEEMFGRSAPRVIRHVEKIRDLADAEDKALKDAETKTSERQSQLATDMEQRREAGRKAWQEINAELATRYPRWFAPDPEDKEGNTLLEKGFALTDRLFNATEETRPKTPLESVHLQAIIRNKAANHDRLAFQLKQERTKRAEVEQRLAEYEQSTPPGGGGGAPGGDGAPADWRKADEAELDALDK